MNIIGTLPYTLTNGQTADASQVMADLNAIVNSVNDVSTGAAPIPSVQANAWNFAADTGTVNALIISPTAPPTSYSNAPIWLTQAANTTTSSTPTLTIGGLAALTIVNRDGSAHIPGSIISGKFYQFWIDTANSKAVLLNPSIVSGSFTATLTGFTTTVTVSVTYLTDGKTVTLNIPLTTGTSNATSMTMTGLPTTIQPSVRSDIPCMVTDSGSNAFGIASISGTTITFYNGAYTPFTASGTKGVRYVSMTYKL